MTVISRLETPLHGPQVKDSPKRSSGSYFLHRDESAVSSQPIPSAQAPASPPGRPRPGLPSQSCSLCLCSYRCFPEPLDFLLTPPTPLLDPSASVHPAVSQGARTSGFSFNPVECLQNKHSLEMLPHLTLWQGWAVFPSQTSPAVCVSAFLPLLWQELEGTFSP